MPAQVMADLIATWRELDRVLERLDADDERAVALQGHVARIREHQAQLTRLIEASHQVVAEARAAIEASGLRDAGAPAGAIEGQV